MLHKFGEQLVFAKHTGSDRCCDRRLEVCRHISFPYFPRSVLMESMHELVELERIDFAAIPTIELRAQHAEGCAQVSIMGDPRPFSNQASDPLRNFLDRSCLANAPAHPRRLAVRDAAASRAAGCHAVPCRMSISKLDPILPSVHLLGERMYTDSKLPMTEASLR